MNSERETKLKTAGWHVGSTADFLGLSREEAAYVELRFRLSRNLRQRRKERGWTQSELAAKIGSSQSRIAKAEANDPSVSVDLLVRALFAIGLTNSGLGELLRNSDNTRAA